MYSCTFVCYSRPTLGVSQSFSLLARKLRRSELQKANLLRVTPDVNEQHIIHKLFLDTVDPQDLTFERRLLPPNGRWMSETAVTNIINSHPEVQFHGNILSQFLSDLLKDLISHFLVDVSPIELLG